MTNRKSFSVDIVMKVNIKNNKLGSAMPGSAEIGSAIPTPLKPHTQPLIQKVLGPAVILINLSNMLILV